VVKRSGNGLADVAQNRATRTRKGKTTTAAENVAGVRGNLHRKKEMLECRLNRSGHVQTERENGETTSSMLTKNKGRRTMQASKTGGKNATRVSTRPESKKPLASQETPVPSQRCIGKQHTKATQDKELSSDKKLSP